MIVSAADSSCRECRRAKIGAHRRRGSVAIELCLGLLVIVLGAYVAGGAVARSRQRARCDALAADVRTFAAAFQQYHRQQGTYPPANFGSNDAPRGMESALKGTAWLERTPVGGRYAWIAPYPGAGSRVIGAIAITAFIPEPPLDLSRADLRYLDDKLDDGNLATGNFRTGFNGWPVFLVTN